jgi:hypothetical protein
MSSIRKIHGDYHDMLERELVMASSWSRGPEENYPSGQGMDLRLSKAGAGRPHAPERVLSICLRAFANGECNLGPARAAGPGSPGPAACHSMMAQWLSHACGRA